MEQRMARISRIREKETGIRGDAEVAEKIADGTILAFAEAAVYL